MMDLAHVSLPGIITTCFVSRDVEKGPSPVIVTGVLWSIPETTTVIGFPVVSDSLFKMPSEKRK